MITAEQAALIEGGRVPDDVGIDILARRLPKAELHGHIGGSYRPSLGLIPSPLRPDAPLDYVDAAGFFAELNRLGALFTSARALTEAVIRILEGNVDNGVRHAELTLQPKEFERSPLTEAEVLDAAGAAFLEMRDRTGLTGGVIVSTSRAHDGAAAVETVETAQRARDRGVPILGIGNDGALEYPLSEYHLAYDRARSYGLRTTCHVDVPEDTAPALDLGVDRIDHGLQLTPEQIEICRRRDIPLTLTLTSYAVMMPGLFPTIQAVPFEKYRKAGLKVSLNTDDPAFFYTDLAQEYRLAARSFGWDAGTLAEVALVSLESAWLDEATRASRLKQWRREAHALLTDPRNPGAVLASA